MNNFEICLQSLVKCLKELKIDYVILGGIAVAVYGEPRLTADIDVNVILDKDKLTNFLTKTEKYGFYPDTPDIEIFAKKTGVIPMNFKKGKATGKCDIIIAENIIEYTGIQRGKIKKIGSIQLKLISPEDLVIHKILSSRPRDNEDLIGIIIRQKNKLNIKYVFNWLKKIDKTDKKLQLCARFKTLLEED